MSPTARLTAPLIGRLVAASTRHALLVVLAAVALTGLAVTYVANHFALTADTSKLISPTLEWRQREFAFEKAFPQFDPLNTLVVIDGITPEVAEDAAARLAEALRDKPKLIEHVSRPDGGTFLERNGLLLLPTEQVAKTVEALERAQPLLAVLAEDPSLRGVLTALSRLLEGVRYLVSMSLADAQPMMRALLEDLEAVADGRLAYLSSQALMGGKASDAGPTRRVLLVNPVMDYSALEPGKASSDAIRGAAHALGLDAAHGVTVRLTGLVPLSDEEFATLAEDWHLVLGAMLAALVGILWLAVRSVRVVVAMLLTTLVGLVLTAAVGLAATGRFNLISVAFIPLFVGLGADFSIQFSVRSLAERLERPGWREALAATGGGIGRALALSAASIGAGFFAFLPTTYVGVAELGTIAGLGMIVAFFLSVILLPALLVLMPPPRGLAEVGFTMLAPVDRLVHRQRRAVLVAAAVAAVVSCGLITRLHFDFDPLDLKSPRVESMSTLTALAADPDWTPNAVDVLAPSLAAAQPLVKRLAALPDVYRTMTLDSFIPTDQTAKLEMIGRAAAALAPSLDVPKIPAPSDAELVESLTATAKALRDTAGTATTAPADTARKLADVLDRLRQATPERRTAAERSVALPLQVMLRQTAQMLQAGPVTLETLPRELVRDWVAADGRARIQVLPKPGIQDNDSIRRFAAEIQQVAPDATGRPISISASGDTVVSAFLQAGLYSALAITVLLAVVLRRARDVLLTLQPVVLSGLLTFATCGALGLPMNFTNIIALPLLFGVGVAFNIYFVLAWRSGETDMLQSSLMRAVVFSALTTATAFGALWLSSHPGTASMGRLLMISLGWELLVTLLFRPALLAVPPRDAAE
ncbi:MAG: MMPL family transporter [Reyranellaceae bacterium]